LVFFGCPGFIFEELCGENIGFFLRNLGSGTLDQFIGR
jgi:hypothetical protein